MNYEPTQWKAGDTVTSAKLNKMEQGIANGGGIQIIHVDENDTLDKTWQEIHDGGLGVIIIETLSGALVYEPIIQISNTNNFFAIVTITQGPEGFSSNIYEAQSSNDYPVWYNSNTPTSGDDSNGR